MNTQSIHSVAAPIGLRTVRTGVLRGLRILVAVVSLSAIASCTESPFEPVQPLRQTVACVPGSAFPRDGRTPVCDDDLGDEEEDGKRHKKVAEPQRPS
ncbi:MAG TPA: hypothetical protein VF021_04470 [Longimicrobiales bacterium]